LSVNLTRGSIVTTEAIAVITTSVGIVGSLLGVIIGQQMSRSWQREQWILDRRVDEFRELLDALAESLRVCMTMHADSLLGVMTPKEVLATHSNTMRVIRSRIFVFDEVVRFNIETQWSEAVILHQRMGSVEDLGAAFNGIRFQIVKAARTAQKPWYRRIFRPKMKVSR